MSEIDDFMGGGVTSAKFPDPGTTVSGVIVDEPRVTQQRDFDSGAPKTWDDGSPMKQLVVHVQTDERDPEIPDDDGVRAFYIKSNMKKAVQTALTKAKAKLAVGGTLAITYTHDGENKRGKGSPPKMYAAVYTAPDAAGSFLADPEPQQAQAAPQAAPQPTAQPSGVDLSSLTPEQIAALLKAAAPVS
ncbi:MAG: hypothetical protein ACRDP6_42100 [Actinoallomurus sp.]